MGLNIGGNLITQASSVLTLNTGSGDMRLISTGAVRRPTQVQFQATGNTAAAWVDLANGWNVVSFPMAPVNVNACFNTTNSRFTAPVDGMYFFQASCYLVKDGANAGYYWHPVFGVNGTYSPSHNVNPGIPNYRLRGHGMGIATYEDSHITQVYQLYAGDYVEHYIYSTGSPLNRHHVPYQRFTGFLLG